jgi:hypothetical protein
MNLIMNKKIYIIIILLLSSLPGLLSAQHNLEQETTLPRPGDEYVKTAMEFFPVEKIKSNNSGKKEKTNWNFLKLEEKEKKKTYRMKINNGREVRDVTVEDTIPDYTVAHFDGGESNLITGENNTLFRRMFSGDSLLETGYGNPNQRIEYSKPLLILKFPMELGAEYTSTFTGRGVKDDQVSSIHIGTLTVSIDEFGEMILPQGDTLFSIVRVHESKTEQIRYESLTGLIDINSPVNRDSVEKSSEPAYIITTDTYLWYEEGYRYPVFETVQAYRILKNEANKTETYPFREATYVYAPYEQEFLASDPANEKVKKEKKEKKEKEEKEKKEKEVQPMDYTFYPNPVSDVLNLKFKTQKAGETIITLYDLSGHEIWHHVYPAENGTQQDKISMGSRQAGTYIIRIACGEVYAAEKIFKY